MLIAAPSEFRCDKSTTGFHFAPRLSFTDPTLSLNVSGSEASEFREGLIEILLEYFNK